MEQTRLQELFERWCHHAVSPDEEKELADLLAAEEAERSLTPQMKAIWMSAKRQENISDESSLAVAQRIVQQYQSDNTPVPRARVRFLQPAWVRYAAVLLLTIGIGIVFWLNRSATHQPEQTAGQPSIPHPIMPGGNKAVLTLADGSSIILDTAANGQLTLQGNTRIIKPDAGRLTYQNSGGKDIGFNSITTPTGGQFQVDLPDGTRVWLNAGSSIRFPTMFTGKERKVEISGEAYLEVAKHSAKPFMVALNGAEVQVLGTTLNINAYKDEAAIAVTLVSGSVKVVAENGTEALLKPGKQAGITENASAASTITVLDVNTDQVIAWKNGYFNFDNAGLPVIMRQLQRWYGIEVVYEKEVPSLEFFGQLSRNTPLENVLDALKKNGAHLTMKGRKVIVHP
ncbi:FecR family protein [Pseudoflavitalea rhizosphaerae]|uniref:FecR family protein n=1 Tax=Pseudoflavitalea rhizosphaerae TaxID=1884793 RepID=UPI000F8C9865|nr:FecR family protein [Pseudoflavitalea rhizosphaerae]